MLPREYRLKPLSRSLRKHATRQENHLWYDFLSGYRPHFYRQRIIGSYIADFYCPKVKLVIELDGSQHYQEGAREKDERRTHDLEGLGLKVMRFPNLEIDDNFCGVCERIDEEVRRRGNPQSLR